MARRGGRKSCRARRGGADFVEQPGAGCGAGLPGIAVPGQEGRVVLPGAPARFMDVGLRPPKGFGPQVGGAADGVAALGDIGVKGGFEETRRGGLGSSGVEGHSSSIVVIRRLGVERLGGTANRVGMARPFGSAQGRRGGQEAEEGKLPHSISNFILSGASRE